MHIDRRSTAIGRIRGLLPRCAILAAWALAGACYAAPDASDSAPNNDAVAKPGAPAPGATSKTQVVAGKVGDALKSSAQTVGKAIDHGINSAEGAVKKSADVVSTTLQETGKRIEEKLGSEKSSDSQSGKSH